MVLSAASQILRYASGFGLGLGSRCGTAVGRRRWARRPRNLRIGSSRPDHGRLAGLPGTGDDHDGGRTPSAAEGAVRSDVEPDSLKHRGYSGRTITEV